MSKAFGFVEYGGPETQEFLDRPVPDPGPGMLLVAVRAAGVNPADWKKRRGLFGTGGELPVVMGTEASGVVLSVGAGVTGFTPGDQVFGIAPAGAFAEHTLLAARTTARKPVGVGFAQAAALPVAGAAAYGGLEQLGLRAGQTLLVLGISGGVGTAAAQIARARGLRVIGTASASSAAYVRTLGATPVDYKGPVADLVAAAAPEGVDGLLDLVGGDALRAAAPALRDGGRLVSTVDRDGAAALGGGYLAWDPRGTVLAGLADLVAAGELDPHISATYPLAHAAEAMAEIESGHARGKLILEMS
ncbi:NADP-dependent oxidoreductase [Kitasatospora sp. NPDC048365]|uniref:NADP-dependent oxidoreductase n=1 Tax=Kitasatospora sp. NPDC048365 TaxID=3364050 RepID=UPI0037119CF8